ncbi:MAG: hypothetical protein HC794_01810 [Nitrospiraceae bacterium]|nr:hypothetical protein [Nitrospiraceae bacterium]
MLTIEIKVNGRLVECVSVVQLENQHDMVGFDEAEDPEGIRLYRVNGVFDIEHRRGDGHRVLARKALNVVKQMKR